MLRHLPDHYSKWDHIPWVAFRWPSEVWKDQPTFVFGELLFIVGALIALAHAKHNGRLYLLAWVSALVAGTANDAFFMWIPIVDNFWQAQAAIMLSPRMPLYISCVYINFMYFATVAVWKLKLPHLAEAVLTGICAELIYAPYDIVGIKFLWWTWHDTDSSISMRLFGVPIGSSLWVVTFTATFAYLFRITTAHARFEGLPLTLRDCGRTFCLVSACSTPLMMLQMTALQGVSGLESIVQNGFPPCPLPCLRGLIILLLCYGCIVFKAASKQHLKIGKAHSNLDLLLNMHLIVHFSVLLAIIMFADPATHVSTSMQQRYGPCDMQHLDITGNRVTEFVCARDYQEDYTLDCASQQAAQLLDPSTRSAAFVSAGYGIESIEAARTVSVMPEVATSSDKEVMVAEWYTVCGKAHTDYAALVAAVATLALCGGVAYSCMLGGLHKMTNQPIKYD